MPPEGDVPTLRKRANDARSSVTDGPTRSPGGGFDSDAWKRIGSGRHVARERHGATFAPLERVKRYAPRSTVPQAGRLPRQAPDPASEVRLRRSNG